MPKELISRFVKLCPTCSIRRPSQRDVDAPAGDKDSPEGESGCPDTPLSGRDSLATPKRESVSVHPPLSMHGFSSTFAQQNRWMTDLPASKSRAEYYETMSPASYAPNDESSATASQYPTRMSQHLNSMPFPLGSTGLAEISSPSGFPSSNVRSTSNWSTVHSAYSPTYSVKQERCSRPGNLAKQEHQY